MAGTTIYLGNLFGGMITALNSQIAKLDTMITNLSAINIAVGQSIPAGIIKASTVNQKSLVHAEIDVATASVYTEVARVSVYANGSLRIKARMKTSATDAMGLYYSLDGGTTKTAVKTFAAIVAAYTDYYLDIDVTTNKTLILYGMTTGVTKHLYIEANSLKFAFDLINVAVDGYVV